MGISCLCGYTRMHCVFTAGAAWKFLLQLVTWLSKHSAFSFITSLLVQPVDQWQQKLSKHLWFPVPVPCPSILCPSLSISPVTFRNSTRLPCWACKIQNLLYYPQAHYSCVASFMRRCLAMHVPFILWSNHILKRNVLWVSLICCPSVLIVGQMPTCWNICIPQRTQENDF